MKTQNTRFCAPGLNNYGVADPIQIGGLARVLSGPLPLLSVMSSADFERRPGATWLIWECRRASCRRRVLWEGCRDGADFCLTRYYTGGVAGEEFDGIPLSELPIDEVVWSEERARHIPPGPGVRARRRSTLSRCGRARRPWTRTGWCAAAAAPSRWRCWVTRRRRGGCCWCGSTAPGVRRLGSGRVAAR
jgi:hypothetical protein